jgi:hypothetical protein
MYCGIDVSAKSLTVSVQSAQNQNRLHAAHGSTSTPGCIVQDLKRSVTSLELRNRRVKTRSAIAVRHCQGGPIPLMRMG